MKIIFIILILTIEYSGFAQYNKNSCKTFNVTNCKLSYPQYDSDTAFTCMNTIDRLIRKDACGWHCHINAKYKIMAIENCDTLKYKLDSINQLKINKINNAIGNKISIQSFLTSGKKGKATFVTGILLINGNRNSQTDYLKYSRIKKVKLVLNNKILGFEILIDKPNIQYINLEKGFKINSLTKANLDIIIESIYEGTESKSVCFSGLELDGTNGHSMVKSYCIVE